ncbi:MAG: hypothetical protein ACRDVM_07030, partial [Acidimicrobiia bacterium]
MPVSARRNLMAAVAALLSWAVAVPALAHGSEVDVVVEAARLDAHQVGYQVSLVYADGDRVTGASVSIELDGDGVEAEETTPGVYVGELTFPDEGGGQMAIRFDHPDFSGSVDFPEPLDMALGSVVVRVDTLDPSRVGSIVEQPSETSSAPPVGTGLEVRVEALVRDAVRPLEIAYAVRLPGPGLAVTLTASGPHGASGGTAFLRHVADGIYLGELSYPEGGEWNVSLRTYQNGSPESVSFLEKLPWPHYST